VETPGSPPPVGPRRTRAVGPDLDDPRGFQTDLAEALGQLTDYGGRVVVFLDGVHNLDEPLQSENKLLVRELQRKRGAITFIASKEGPSGADRPGQHGFFAMGITQVFQSAGPSGDRKDRSAAYTLDQFRAALR
jgi:hypothetical protein